MPHGMPWADPNDVLTGSGGPPGEDQRLQKSTVTLNRRKRGLSTLVGRSHVSLSVLL